MHGETVSVGAGRLARMTIVVPGQGPVAAVSSLAALKGIAQFSPVVLNDAIVLAGTDTIPGTLILTDRHRRTALRVNLAENPVLPFQAGDIVAVRGQWDPTTGEPVLDNTVARWTGALSAMDSSPLHRVLEGEVLDRSGHILLADGRRVRVLLGARKEPGIEEEPRDIAIQPGSHVRAAGIWNPADRRAEIAGTLYPITPADVKVIRGTGENVFLRFVLWIGIALAAAALAYLLVRLRARR
jgi:hypothetical protein